MLDELERELELADQELAETELELGGDADALQADASPWRVGREHADPARRVAPRVVVGRSAQHAWEVFWRLVMNEPAAPMLARLGTGWRGPGGWWIERAGLVLLLCVALGAAACSSATTVEADEPGGASGAPARQAQASTGGAQASTGGAEASTGGAEASTGGAGAGGAGAGGDGAGGDGGARSRCVTLAEQRGDELAGGEHAPQWPSEACTIASPFSACQTIAPAASEQAIVTVRASGPFSTLATEWPELVIEAGSTIIKSARIVPGAPATEIWADLPKQELVAIKLRAGYIGTDTRDLDLFVERVTFVRGCP